MSSRTKDDLVECAKEENASKKDIPFSTDEDAVDAIERFCKTHGQSGHRLGTQSFLNNQGENKRHIVLMAMTLYAGRIMLNHN
jgi:hypothetical protein